MYISEVGSFATAVFLFTLCCFANVELHIRLISLLLAGNDVARCILVFAKAKPLGPNGLNWLKIHLVNLTGLKKRSSNADRLQFANEMMPQILDSADRPFEVGLLQLSHIVV